LTVAASVVRKRRLNVVLVRSDEGYVGTRPTPSYGRVDKRRLEESTVLSVGEAWASLEVSDAREGAVASVRLTSRYVLSVQDECGGPITTPVNKADSVLLGADKRRKEERHKACKERKNHFRKSVKEGAAG